MTMAQAWFGDSLESKYSTSLEFNGIAIRKADADWAKIQVIGRKVLLEVKAHGKLHVAGNHSISLTWKTFFRPVFGKVSSAVMPTR